MEPSGLLLGVMIFIGVLLVLGLFGLISRAKAWLRGEPFLTAQRFRQARESVKTFPAVMSREEDAAPPDRPVRSEDGRWTDGDDGAACEVHRRSIIDTL